MLVTLTQVNAIPRETKLSREEGYTLTKYYVEYFWSKKKFYSLVNIYECSDVVNEIYMKFLEQGLFEKYNPEITTKKYLVMRCVSTSMIDMLRKQLRHREPISLDKSFGNEEEDLTFGDTIASDEDLEVNVESSLKRDLIINSLPDESDSVLEGRSPILGECKFSLRVIALHLEYGYSAKEIASMFYNRKLDRTTTAGNVNGMIRKLREYLLKNILSY